MGMFDNLRKNLSDLHGSHEYTANELFPAQFMRAYTQFKNHDEFVQNCGFSVTNIEEIPQPDLDNYVKRVTQFPSWDEMRTKAVSELISR